MGHPVNASMAMSQTTPNTNGMPKTNPNASLTFADARHLRQFVALAEPTGDELKVRLDRDGLHGKAVDAAHVLMGTYHVGPAGLDGYDLRTPGETAIDLDKLKAAGKSFSLGTPAGLSINGDVTATQGRIKRSHPGMDPSGFTDPKVPDLDLPGEATIPDVGELEKFVRYARKETADHVRVTICPTEGLTVKAEGDLCADTYHAPADEIAPNHALQETVSSVYSCDYLTTLLKACKTMETCTDGTTRLFLGNDYPLRVRVNNGVVEGVFLLAPRIESA